MNQNYKALQEIAHRIALDVAIGTMHVIIPEEQPQTQTAQNLCRDCEEHMSFVAMFESLEREKTLFEFTPKNWTKKYDAERKKWIWIERQKSQGRIMKSR